MHDLGVSRSRVRFLGFPDEGLCELADIRSPSTVFVSPYTHRDRPPAPERIVGGAKYRGDDARAELEELFTAFRPTLIVLPDGHDEHPDHCATHMLVHEAADAAVSRGLHQPRLLHYLIHYRGWPLDQTRAPNDSPVAVLKLSAVERAAKLRAIDAYRSQLQVMPAFMHAFAAADERFVVGDAESLPACWCRGENIAAPKKSADVAKQPR
jgi:LmbE family N-acetylglucosaminyl deacetylase